MSVFLRVQMYACTFPTNVRVPNAKRVVKTQYRDIINNNKQQQQQQQQQQQCKSVMFEYNSATSSVLRTADIIPWQNCSNEHV